MHPQTHPPKSGLLRAAFHCLLLACLCAGGGAAACSLSFTSPARGSTVTTATISVSGTGSGFTTTGASGVAEAYVNGQRFFNYSGVFTATFNFSGGASAPAALRPGANILSLTGSANGCSASDSMTVFYVPPVPKKNSGQPQDCNGTNPVNGGTGNKYQLETDYAGTDAAPGFARHYNSADGDPRHLGPRWRHSYDRQLTFSGANAYLARPDGRVLHFAQSGAVWSPDADGEDRLSPLKNAAGAGVGWLYQAGADGSLEQYDASGRLLSAISREGDAQDVAYDTAGRLASVTERLTGRQLRFAYDNADRLSQMTDPAGGVTVYQYDASNRLVSVVYPDATPADASDNPKRQYHYEDARFAHALTGISDENGARFATFAYDAQGRAVSSEHAGGADRHTLQYHADGSATVTGPLATGRVFGYQTVQGVAKTTGQSQPAGAGCAASASSITYDANGNVQTRTDFNGNLSCHAYDSARNLETTRVEGLAPGSICPGSYTPAANSAERKTTTAWHPVFRLETRRAEPLKLTTWVYNGQPDPANGNAIASCAPAAALLPDGNPIAVLCKKIEQATTDASGAAGLSATPTGTARVWRYTYNASGQRLTEDGPRTDVADTTTYRYYADTTATHRQGDLWQAVNALGHTTTFAAYDAHGRAAEIQDPNGLPVQLAYDARGRLAQKTVDGFATRYGYDAAGNLKKLTLPSGVNYQYTYDDAHRLTDITDALGGTIHYTLDAAGNRTKEAIFEAGGTAPVKTQSRAYDTLGRLAQDIGAYNQTTTYEYDANGNLTRQTDPNGHATAYAYDALDRLKTQTDALQGITRYGYDAADHLTQVTDANNQTTAYQYNGLGDLLREASPNTGTTQFVYDSAGNLRQKTDAAGTVATYAYDALNRPTGIDYPGTEADVAYAYDGKPYASACCRQPVNRQYQNGRLTASWRGGVSDFRLYDRRGYPTYAWTAAADGRPSRITLHEPGVDGELMGIHFLAFPGIGDRHVSYRYDAAGQVEQVGVADYSDRAANPYPASHLLAGDIRHLPFGPVKSLAYGNGLALTRRHDLDYRRTGQTVGPALNPAQNLAYAYDPAGQLQTVADLARPARSEAYGYDPLDRLLTAQGGYGSLAYAYDAVGNRAADYRDQAQSLYGYDPASQRLQALSGAKTDTLAHDANGNVTQAGGKAFAYAPDQRLKSASQGGAELARYAYDAAGRRLSKTLADGRVTAYSYGPAGHLLSDGEPAAHYAWLDGEPLARVAGQADGGWDILYYHNTPLGTPHTATGPAGEVAWTADAEPFGQSAAPGPAAQSLRFPGQFFDAETGLHYNMARYYHPGLGRYLQSDPIGLAGGVNTYGYVGGNPVNYTDPEGLCGPACGYVLQLVRTTVVYCGKQAVKWVWKWVRKNPENGQKNWPKTRDEVDKYLTSRGYTNKGTSPNGYTTYKGPDGRTVTIKPDGEVIPTQRVWKEDGSGKYPQRQDWEGNPLPDQSHSTGHYVD